MVLAGFSFSVFYSIVRRVSYTFFLLQLVDRDNTMEF